MFPDFINRFNEFYYKPIAKAYPAWEPTLQRQTGWEYPDSVISLGEAVENALFQIPAALKEQLDLHLNQIVYEKILLRDIPFLEKQGFVFIQSKERLIFYHSQLPDYLIKIDLQERRSLPMERGLRLNMHQTNLLRPIGEKYLREKIQTSHREMGKYFEIPREFYYRSPYALADSPLQYRYFSISERKDILSGRETLSQLRATSDQVQSCVAHLFIQFIHATGYHDFHRDNIVLHKKEGRFVCIDTEPIGIKIAEPDIDSACLFQPVEHILLGMINFMEHYCIREGLVAMADTVHEEIIHYLKIHPEISVTHHKYYTLALPITHFQRAQVALKLVVSLLCPLIPLALLIYAAVCSYFPKSHCHPWDKYERVIGFIPKHPEKKFHFSGCMGRAA